MINCGIWKKDIKCDRDEKLVMTLGSWRRDLAFPTLFHFFYTFI